MHVALWHHIKSTSFARRQAYSEPAPQCEAVIHSQMSLEVKGTDSVTQVQEYPATFSRSK